MSIAKSIPSDTPGSSASFARDEPDAADGPAPSKSSAPAADRKSPSKSPPNSAGKFPMKGKPVRAHAPATSRPRPNMMRPGRATLDEQEPCPACLPKRAARQRQQKGTESKETVPSLAPGGAKSLSSTVARTSPKRASRKKRIRLADAFRSRGIDEYVIADGYAVALKTLKPKEGGATEASIGKTFMDTLKECSRILDPPRTSTERGASDAPAVVQLIHRVPRPARGRDGLPQG